MNWKSWQMLTAAIVACGISGCAGGEPVTSGSFVTDAAPLPTIERDIWELAPAGCEDVLNAEVEFGIADAAPELVVVLGPDGVLCVDTYSSLEADLVTIDPERMDALWLGYVAALQEVEAFSDPSYRNSNNGAVGANLDTEYDPREAQPQPQPSMGSPVSLEEASVQPQPQPSEPTPPAGSGNESSSGTRNMPDAPEDAPAPPMPTL